MFSLINLLKRVYGLTLCSTWYSYSLDIQNQSVNNSILIRNYRFTNSSIKFMVYPIMSYRHFQIDFATCTTIFCVKWLLYHHKKLNNTSSSWLNNHVTLYLHIFPFVSWILIEFITLKYVNYAWINLMSSMASYLWFLFARSYVTKLIKFSKHFQFLK